MLADGEFLGATVDHADPDWPMGPRPDIRRVKTAIGPVLVFAASNFPFAFSVAGGDTASALAAGCPVILKAHPGHPELSALTGRILREALVGAGAPEGIFDVIFGQEEGVTALKDPRIAAASFTGSVPGGRALFDIANARPRPIPFYGELGSVNPVVVTEAAIAARGEAVAKGYAGSFTLGAGQFCTKPGLLFLPEDHNLDLDPEGRAGRGRGPADAQRPHRRRVRFQAFIAEARSRASRSCRRRIRRRPGVHPDACWPPPAKQFLEGGDTVHEECFGPASLIVTYADQAELLRLLDVIEPGLTATIHGEESDVDWIRARAAGR